MGRLSPLLLALFVILPAPGCQRCSDRSEASDPAAGLPPPVEPRAGRAPLPWEAVALGADVTAFRVALGELAGIPGEDVAVRVACAPRATVEVIEPGGEVMVERTAAGHDLEGCALLQAGSGSSSPLASVRGDFVDGRLASVTFVFPAGEETRLRRDLEKRLGPATRRAMTLRTRLGDEARDADVWNVAGAAWLLLPGERATTLVHQDPRSAAGLGRPEPVPARGQPVNLDDIGLGGGLDLDSPVQAPDLSAIRALLDAADAGDAGTP
jgi:hypothetical protein